MAYGIVNIQGWASVAFRNLLRDTLKPCWRSSGILVHAKLPKRTRGCAKGGQWNRVRMDGMLEKNYVGSKVENIFAFPTRSSSS